MRKYSKELSSRLDLWNSPIMSFAFCTAFLFQGVRRNVRERRVRTGPLAELQEAPQVQAKRNVCSAA